MRSRLCRLISMSVTTLLMLATAMGQERAARSVTYQPNLESIGEHQVPRWLSSGQARNLRPLGPIFCARLGAALGRVR